MGPLKSCWRLDEIQKAEMLGDHAFVHAHKIPQVLESQVISSNERARLDEPFDLDLILLLIAGERQFLCDFLPACAFWCVCLMFLEGHHEVN